MQGSDFLNVAQDLCGSQREEDLRTSVGRSYYALFNDVRERVRPLKFLPGHDEDHRALVEYLTKCSNRDLFAVGQHLKDLRHSRNIADYEMADVVNGAQAQTALRKARDGVQKFGAVNDPQLRADLAALASFKARS